MNLHFRLSKRKTSTGGVRQYGQLVRSVRGPNGVPSHQLVAHLGPVDDASARNYKIAIAAARDGNHLAIVEHLPHLLQVHRSLQFLPLAVLHQVMTDSGLRKVLAQALTPNERTIADVDVIEALILHRCIDPGSKSAFQQWHPDTAVAHVLKIDADRLNNTRVHRALTSLYQAADPLASGMTELVTTTQGVCWLFLDVTDVWFVAGGGEDASKGKTKEGMTELKINLALLVNDDGFPLRWEFLPGALSEARILPRWLDYLRKRKDLEQTVLIFDRGIISVENLQHLCRGTSARQFLTSVRRNAISSYVTLDPQKLDAIQAVPDGESTKINNELTKACAALGLSPVMEQTYGIDLGTVKPPPPRKKCKKSEIPDVPPVRLYLYFNREVQLTTRANRQAKLQAAREYVDNVNSELADAQRTRKEGPTVARVQDTLRYKDLSDLLDVTAEPVVIQREHKTKTAQVTTYRLQLLEKPEGLRKAAQLDGVTLLLGHPDLDYPLEKAVRAYRAKAMVEADFRIVKSVLEVRPVFHWTQAKIRAHIIVCILALFLNRYIEKKLAPVTAQLSAPAPRSAPALLQMLSKGTLSQCRLGDMELWCVAQVAMQHASLLQVLGAESYLTYTPAKRS